MDLPSDEALRFILTRYAALRAAHGEAFGDPDLLTPTGAHFPDAFEGDHASVRRLVDRMIGYAPLSDELPYEVGVREPDPRAASGGCGSGACGGGGGAEEALGTVAEQGDRYVIALARRECHHPILLAAALARATGSLILHEAGEPKDPAFPATSEIAATMGGFGLLLIGGAAHYAKGCGGLTLHRVTALSVGQLAVALALFLRLHGVKPSVARAHLETTQREAFDVALQWVDSNEALVRRLRTSPGDLADGLFTFQAARGAVSRFFSRAKDDDELAPPDAASFTPKRTPRTEEERRRIAEAKALVEEALREG